MIGKQHLQKGLNTRYQVTRTFLDISFLNFVRVI